MDDVGDNLQLTLDELDRFIEEEHPGLYPRFRPGLSDREIEQLAARLQPYYLPAELIVLYGWHDGWEFDRDGEYADLLPDAQFNSLADAIAQYQLWCEAIAWDGWHPLWFPAFGEQSGELVVLQLDPGRPAGELFSFHTDLGLESSYDSVSALFAATLECWRRRLLPPRDRAYLTPELRELVARFNPLSQTPDGLGRREISRSATADWPAQWRDVLGLAPLVPAPADAVVTVAELLANPDCGRPIRANVRGWGGSADAAIVTATDGTGEVVVLLKRGVTENYRELMGGGRYELWLVPLDQRRGADELAADMGQLVPVPPVSHLATRIVPC